MPRTLRASHSGRRLTTTRTIIVNAILNRDHNIGINIIIIIFFDIRPSSLTRLGAGVFAAAALRLCALGCCNWCC